MNKVIMMGRLTKDPELRMTQEGTGVCRYTLAVNRSFKRDGEPDADFFNCVVFGNRAEFASKYFSKGLMVLIVGSLRTSKYKDKQGVERTAYDIVVDEQHFAESKKKEAKEAFVNIEDEGDMPF